MKAILTTLATSEIAPHCAEFVENKLAYARYRNYDFYCGHQHDQDWAPAWEKLRILNMFLHQDYDFVIWADMDSAIMNYTVPATQLIFDNEWMGAVKEFTLPIDEACLWFYSHICTCLMVIRVCDASKEFFKHVDDIRLKSDHWDHPWEQEAINNALKEPDRNYGGVRQWQPVEIGGGWPAPTDEGYTGWHIRADGGMRGWCPGEFLFHFGGVGLPWEIRRREFVEKYQKQIILG